MPPRGMMSWTYHAVDIPCTVLATWRPLPAQCNFFSEQQDVAIISGSISNMYNLCLKFVHRVIHSC